MFTLFSFKLHKMYNLHKCPVLWLVVERSSGGADGVVNAYISAEVKHVKVNSRHR